jgi:hypothetical protein
MNLLPRIQQLLFSAFLMSAHCSGAADISSVSCSEPDGIRDDRIGAKTKQGTDKFSGVSPQFIFSKSNASKLTVIWPDSKTFGVNAKQNAHEATIIESTESMVSAVTVYGERVDLYTLYPNKGVAFMSTHKKIPVQGGIPSASLFKMDCTFEFN